MNGSRITVGMLAAVILLLAALYPYIYITSRPTPTTVTATVTTATTVTVTTTTPFITHTIWTVTETVTTTVLRDVNISLLSLDSEISVTARRELSTLRIYITNNGNETKHDVLVVVVKAHFALLQVLYTSEVRTVDTLEPGTTLRVDVGIDPTVYAYWIIVLR